MTDREKFEGFKHDLIAENEKKYGQEIRQNYGEETVQASNQQFFNMSEADYQNMQAVEAEMIESLKEFMATGDLESAAARHVYENHKAWLSYTWPSYSPEAHRGLAEMYVADERFAQYYNDRAGTGAAVALRNAIVKYA